MANKKKPTIKDDGREHYEGFTITKHTRDTGRSFFDVNLGRALGRKRPRFDTLKEARTYARKKRIEVMNHGISGQKLTERQKNEAAEFFKIAKEYGISIRTALEFYKKHHQPVDESNGFGSAVIQYWDFNKKRLENNEIRPRYYKDLKTLLSPIKDDFGHLVIDAISASDIDQWLDENKPRPTSRKNHRTCINGFFNWAVEQGKLEVNPVNKTRKVKKAKHTVSIYTPEQVEAVMTAAQKFGAEKTSKRIKLDQCAIIPYLALGYFGGIRPDEILRLSWNDINFEIGEIHVHAESSKTVSARLVHIEQNLRAFLLPYRKHDGSRIFPYSDSTLKRWRTKIYANAQIKMIQDGARHSYGTYHLAKYESVDKTMREMGHTQSKTLHDFYVGLAENRHKQAEKYFGIMPLPDKSPS